MANLTLLTCLHGAALLQQLFLAAAALQLAASQATEDEVIIKKAFRQLALKWHPDKNGNSEESTTKFQMVSAAYARLTSADASDDDLDDLDPNSMDMEDLFGDIGIDPMLFFAMLFGGPRGFGGTPRGFGGGPRGFGGGPPFGRRGGPGIVFMSPGGFFSMGGPPAPFGAGGRRGGPPPRGGGGHQYYEDDDDDDEWETDDEDEGMAGGAGSRHARGSSGHHGWGGYGSSDRWERKEEEKFNKKTSQYRRAQEAQVLYQLDYRPASSAAAWSSRLSQQQLVEVTNLQPGTKYVFRARGGYAAPDAVQRAAAASDAAGEGGGAAAAAAAAEGVSWRDFSVESSYATSVQSKGMLRLALKEHPSSHRHSPKQGITGMQLATRAAFLAHQLDRLIDEMLQLKANDRELGELVEAIGL
ncbi:hypothetical protein COO60DRAFT_1457934 [Scenedesmus sp. NREL 46B-D3]|nr:hypothetical protein COO60DRAFT_1457934 [Scenedesmus sp. NREL 46B-D3]